MYKKNSVQVGAAFAFLALLITAIAIAQGNGSSVIWDSFSDRGISTGGPYVIADAVGETFAGESSGGGYSLTDGGAPGTNVEPPTPPPGSTPTPSPTPLTPTSTPTPTPTPPPDDWELNYLPFVIGN